MNYIKCKKMIAFLVVIGCVVLLFALLRGSMALLLIGFALILISLPIKMLYWRCPHCGAPLPWSRLGKGAYSYRCNVCGNEIEGL